LTCLGLTLALNSFGQRGFQVVEADGVSIAENSAIGFWPNHSGLPFELALEQIFGVDAYPANAILGRIGPAALAIDEAGNVYVRDAQYGRLVSFGPNGVVRWSVGQRGQGPGAIYGTGAILYGDAKLYVLEQQGTRIDTWTTQGDFLSSHSLDELDAMRARLTGFIDPGRLVLNRSPAEVPGTEVVVVDVSRSLWAVTGRFTITVADPTPDPLRNRGTSIAARVSGDSVWVGNNGDYALQEAGLDGRVHRTITSAVDYLQRPGFFNEGRISFVYLGELDAPLRLPSGELIVYALWPENVDDPDAFAALRRSTGERPDVVWMSSIDVFDETGRLTGSAVWEGAREPEIGRPAAVDANGRLYTVATDPFPQVRRYRIGS